jgi:hypothetical protein
MASATSAANQASCPKVTVNGKTRYLSYKSAPLAGLKEGAILAFAPVYGVFMLLLTLFFFWISTKTKGAAHWITLIISLISLWTTGKTAYNWYNAKTFLDKNLMDACDAPAPAEKTAYEKNMMSGSAPVAKTVAGAPVVISKTA